MDEGVQFARYWHSWDKEQAHYLDSSNGANNCGQLGLGLNHTDDQSVPTHCSIVSGTQTGATAEDIKLRDVGGGGGFSYALTENGRLLTCGNNERGQLGFGNRENRSIFSPVSCLTHLKIKKVVAGWDFIISITDAGQVFSWGSNSFEQLGRPLNSQINFDTSPGEVSFPSKDKQVDVAAGLRHALSLAENGKVFSWGNGKKGQLGLMDDDKNPVIKSNHPLPVAGLNDESVVQVVAGMYHSSILTVSGHVFVWGCNKYGQCGHNPQSSQTHPFPQNVALLGKGISLPCRQLASGWTHLVAKTDCGDLYSWGRGDLGQLGRPCSKSCDHMPGEVIGLSQVKMHACGSEHNLALTEEGKIYAWGWNEHGICGTNNEENVPEPVQVPSLKNADVVSIGCGAGHSFCSVTTKTFYQ